MLSNFLLSIRLQGKCKRTWYCEEEGFVSGPRGSTVCRWCGGDRIQVTGSRVFVSRTAYQESVSF